jgi:hypothetical protein
MAQTLRYINMKSLIQAVAIAAVLAAPVASFAQSNDSTSRSQVRAELTQLERAGYDAHSKGLYYPADIQASEARVAAQSAPARPEITSFGGAGAGSSASGVLEASEAGRSTYSRH